VAPLYLFLRVHTSLSKRNGYLNDLKHAKSSGCMAWNVWDRRVKRSKPKLRAVLTTSIVTWEPCPSRMSKCRHSGELCKPHSRTFLTKCPIHDLKKTMTHHPCFLLHDHGCIVLALLNIITLKALTNSYLTNYGQKANLWTFWTFSYRGKLRILGGNRGVHAVWMRILPRGMRNIERT
jgi:hypothetical protein